MERGVFFIEGGGWRWSSVWGSGAFTIKNAAWASHLVETQVPMEIFITWNNNLL